MHQKIITLISTLIFFINFSFGQDAPVSLLNSDILKNISIVDIINPQDDLNKKEDNIELFNYTFAIALNNEKLIQKGTWIKTKDNNWIWILKINASEAKSLAFDFNKIDLKEKDKLYIFNNNKNVYNISKTNLSTNNSYSSKYFNGNNISIEYSPNSNDTLSFFTKNITLNYAFKEVNGHYGFGTSGDCEINADCNTDEEYQPEKRSVVRIRTVKTVDGKTWLGWCTGTIIGNTNQDSTPYMITADHCYNYMIDGNYEGASTQDLENWIFYFNYESDGCDSPQSEGTLANEYIQGASYKANSGTAGDADSDFCLLELNQRIPNEYNVFWAGWDSRNIPSSNGYSYHHPSGDIKKINTYSSLLASSQYDERGPSNTHWRVFWETGVTEAGSSGSSILNSKGQIIGILTGGGSSCSSTTSSDLYGKISYSWEYKPENNKQLKHWLNPNNSAVESIIGYDNSGLKKIKYTENVNLHPNPVLDGKINFGNIDTDLLNEILIYNINGQLVLKQVKPNSTEMKLNLPSGIYFAKTNYNNNVTVNKLLIVN